MNDMIKLATVAMAIFTLASCGHDEPKKVIKKQRDEYRVMTLENRRIAGDIRLPGVLLPFQQVKIFPKLNGFVKQVYADRGTTVKRGQVLLVLEAPEIEQDVAAARLKYTQAQALFLSSKDRYRRLLETSKTPGTVAVYDIEAAATKLQGDSAIAQGEYANYKAKEVMKAYLTVIAPFDGVITERNVHPGTLVGPGTQNGKPLLELQQLSRLRLQVDVPEQYVTQVKEGDKARYRVNAIPGQDFTGIIARSARSLSDNYRSEAIEIDVVNDRERFSPGMYVEVSMTTSGNANAFIVPVSAVVTTTEKKYVIVVDNNVARWVDVSEGSRNNDSTEIFGNLSAGARIITNAGYQIKDGVTIQ